MTERHVKLYWQSHRMLQKYVWQYVWPCNVVKPWEILGVKTVGVLGKKGWWKSPSHKFTNPGGLTWLHRAWLYLFFLDKTRAWLPGLYHDTPLFWVDRTASGIRWKLRHGLFCPCVSPLREYQAVEQIHRKRGNKNWCFNFYVYVAW